MKKWMLSNWMLVIALTIGGIYLFLWLFIGGKYDNYSFPFHVEVFGSVADWAMVLVTAVTAHYLWKTLQSQNKVQDSQTELLKIERHRFFEAIKPEFKILNCDEIEIKTLKAGNPSVNRKFAEVRPKIKQIKFRAKRVEVSISYRMQNGEPVHLAPLSLGVIENEQEEWLTNIPLEDIPINGMFSFQLDIVINYYDDSLENKYFQKMSFSKKNNVHGGKLTTEAIPPYRITETEINDVNGVVL